MSKRNPKELAAAVGEAMFAVDAASKDFLQMELLACEPGRAVMRMRVRAPMLNGHKICHGGLIFTLAGVVLAGTYRRSGHAKPVEGPTDRPEGPRLTRSEGKQCPAWETRIRDERAA